ncbi:hypothetical protein RF11_01032 [Thelohanellus kitauei]|uniref:Uncharacterized protein n=1 Tax=Thelohanellus kitauei TaxID=669202 RepID=A0A0C2M6J5_THEKT|nr:hypothetical protein RF11_01032 [Thelohanellus kitauei]
MYSYSSLAMNCGPKWLKIRRNGQHQPTRVSFAETCHPSWQTGKIGKKRSERMKISQYSPIEDPMVTIQYEARGLDAARMAYRRKEGGRKSSPECQPKTIALKTEKLLHSPINSKSVDIAIGRPGACAGLHVVDVIWIH